jgi:tetratricopeptide (TPR) repeat protein
MSAHAEPNRLFVRSAWILLLVQLGAAGVALVITAWAWFQVRPLFAQREELRAAIQQQRVQLQGLRQQEITARDDIAQLQWEATRLRAELGGARAATPMLVEGINAFHRKDYKLAVDRYGQALLLNPGDAYVYNLMSYSQFKSGDLTGAIETLLRSLQLNPSYDWGYFDLARYQCAAGRPQDGLDTIARAAEERGDPIRQLAAFFLKEDGEFRRLCSSVLPQIQAIAKGP